MFSCVNCRIHLASYNELISKVLKLKKINIYLIVFFYKIINFKNILINLRNLFYYYLKSKNYRKFNDLKKYLKLNNFENLIFFIVFNFINIL